MKEPTFRRYIGIDYSGAGTPTRRLPGLQVYVGKPGEEPVVQRRERPGKNWTRKELAHWVLEEVSGDEKVMVGIDHAFSFPVSYFKRYRLESWEAFLEDFCRYWPTDGDHCTVDSVRDETIWRPIGIPKPPGERVGQSTEFRLTERWTSSAKSVFQFDVQGSVAKSTHAGIPWLRFLRARCGNRLFFWPFDGWRPPADRSVIAEVYPSMFRRRYSRGDRTPDEQDAFAVACWIEDADRRGALDVYRNPPLTDEERRRAEIEGWILGVY